MSSDKFVGGFIAYPLNFNTKKRASAITRLIHVLKQPHAGYHLIYLKKWESMQMILSNNNNSNVTLGSEIQFLKYFQSTFNTYFMNKKSAPTVNHRSTIGTPDHDIIYVFSKIAEITQSKDNETERNDAVSLFAMNKVFSKLKRQKGMCIFIFK